jgi:hypothetical protein
MEKEVEHMEYKNYTIKLIQDENPMNPREDYDHFAHMICFHRDYGLGDKDWKSKNRNSSHQDLMTPEELKEIVSRKDVIALPLYILDHSGLWMRTGRFAEDSGGWDTSMVGYIYVTYEEIHKNMARPKPHKKDAPHPYPIASIKHVTKTDRDHAIRLMEAEVQEYSDYLSGDVCGYVVEDEEGEVIDSCWGFFGDEGRKYAMSEAKSIVDSLHERWVEKLIEKKVIEIKEEVKC